MIYLDNSASTRPFDEVLDEYINVSKSLYYNPSALHTAGLNAEKAVETARKQVAELMGKPFDDIIFTSGGTESDNIALIGAALAKKSKGNHIITSKIEHKAVLNSVNHLANLGFDVSYVGTDENGVIDMEELKALITDKTVLISVMLVNNETGVVQPVNKVKELAGDILVHTDAVQAFGKVSLKDIKADLISVSSHKIHGPKGVGALYIKKGVRIEPTVFGGGQEKNLRSGTLNVPGILAFGKAAQITKKHFLESVAYLKELREYFVAKLTSSCTDFIINGDLSPVNIISVSFKDVRGEVLLHSLEEKEIFVSTGSACNSKSTKISYVINAMNTHKDYAEGTIRISLSVFNTKDEIDKAVAEISDSVSFLKKFKRR